MAKNWGRTPVTNADNHRLTQTSYLVNLGGSDTEERIDRRPQGKVERFVDPAGNVVSLQMCGDGDAQRHATIVRERSQFHAKGFVEHAKCPIKHGTRHVNPATGREFAKMPASLEGECKQDPKVMSRKDGELYAETGCPHVEWLIGFRVKKEADARKKLNASRVAQEKREAEKQELQAAQLEMVKEQLAEHKARKSKTKGSAE